MSIQRLHVYGVVHASSPPLLAIKGRQGAPVRAYRHGRLAIVVSAYDPSKHLSRGDLLAHAHVLEQIADSHPVLPIRFGVSVPNEEDLPTLIDPAGEWTKWLRKLGKFVQVSVVAAHHPENALREALRRDPSLVSRHPRTHSSQVQLGERIARALELLRHEDSAALCSGLNSRAHAVADETLRGQVLRASYLVERVRRPEFDTAVGQVRHSLPWLEIRYLGPQPPWAFLRADVFEEGTWAS